MIRLPQHEVSGMLFVRLILIADATTSSGKKSIQSIAAQLAVSWKTFDALIDNSIRTNIRMSVIQQLSNHLLHDIDILGRAQDVVGF